jgi:hypothetical protein
MLNSKGYLDIDFGDAVCLQVVDAYVRSSVRNLKARNLNTRLQLAFYIGEHEDVDTI